jgi:hypothetical protein
VIARVWQGWAASGDDADAYERHYRTDALAELGNIQGFVEAKLLRRDVGGEVELVSVTYFVDLEAVRGFAGDSYETAVVADGARAVLSRFEETVRHYDVVT